MSVEFRDATAMAEAVRSGQVSSKELVQDSIRRIEAENPRLNAVVSSRFDQALAEAEALEVVDKPFAGVPILLKDLGQNQAGELSTSGSRLFANYRASQSDNMVKRLEELGFIVLGRTSTPEFGFKNISDSQLHGPVNLPNDLTRNAGGSSGGAGAAVASGMVPLAGASDGGGSIRIPASFNGLIGLKPSRGRIPVGPSSYRGWQGASVHFALTKTVRDTRNLLYHLQTCQLESPFVLPKLDYKSLYQSALKPLKIALLLKPPYLDSFSEDAQTAVRRAGHFLESLGHQVEELAEAPLNSLEAIRGYYVMNSVETAAMFDGIERSLGRAVTKDDMEVMTWAIYQSGQSIPAKRYSAILQDWDRYSATMAKFHQTYDILITPTTNRPAPKHGELTPAKDLMEQLARAEDFSWQEQQDLIWQMFKPSLDWNPYTSQANLTGQPAINLPVHRTKEGLAMGIQLTAAKGREDLLLQLADLFEEAGQFR